MLNAGPDYVFESLGAVSGDCTPMDAVSVRALDDASQSLSDAIPDIGRHDAAAAAMAAAIGGMDEWTLDWYPATRERPARWMPERGVSIDSANNT